MASILVRLFEHHRWANQQAVAACAGLSDEQLDATVVGTIGTIRQTLLHISGAEQRYVRRLSGQPAPGSAWPSAWPGTTALGQALEATGQALIELAGRADADEVLVGEWEGRPYRFPVAVVYAQVINHATEHRSQIATILTQLGLEPPDFSAWAWNEGH